MWTACWLLTASFPQPWHMTWVRVYKQRVVNETVNLQFFVMLLHLPLAPRACDFFLHNTFTLITTSLLIPSFSSFFLPPVYNWILFSGCYKCLCLLCLCLAPHFSVSPPSSPSALIGPIGPSIILSLCKSHSSYGFLQQTVFLFAKPSITLFILSVVTVKYDGH